MNRDTTDYDINPSLAADDPTVGRSCHSVETVPVADAAPSLSPASVPATAERDASRTCIQTWNVFGCALRYRCYGNEWHVSGPSEAAGCGIGPDLKETCDHHVPFYAEPKSDLTSQSIRQAYRDGVGIGYAMALTDLRDAVRARGSVDVSVIEVSNEFFRLLGNLVRRCDAIAEAGGSL